MSELTNTFKFPKVFNFLKRPSSNDYNKPFSYELIGCRRDKSGQQIIMARIINSPRSIFKMSATELVLKHRDVLEQFNIEDVVKIIGIASSEQEPYIIKTMHTSYKYFAVLCMLFGTILLTAHITSSKLISLFGLTIVGGAFSYPFTFVIGDIVTEVYGYKRARQLIWAAVFSGLMFLFFVKLSILAPPSQYWQHQTEFSLILNSIPRITLSSFISYIIGEFLNSYIIAKIKIASNGQNLIKRMLGSSLVAILVDSLIFVTLAYIMIVPLEELFFIFLNHITIKLIFEFITVPFTIKIIQILKKSENVDIYDIDTNFTPFSLDVTYGPRNNKYHQMKVTKMTP